MADPKTEVWGALYEEITWRSSLEQTRPCQVVLVSWLCLGAQDKEHPFCACCCMVWYVYCQAIVLLLHNSHKKSHYASVYLAYV